MNEAEKAAIYNDYSKKVYGYILSHISNTGDAEDICSEVFLKIFEKLESFDSGKSSLSTWIFTITRNTLIDFYRTRRVSEEIPEELSLDFSVENEVEKGEELKTLTAALESLEKKERDLIVLKYYQGLNMTETAKKMQISYSYAKVIHNKALDKLKKFF